MSNSRFFKYKGLTLKTYVHPGEYTLIPVMSYRYTWHYRWNRDSILNIYGVLL